MGKREAREWRNHLASIKKTIPKTNPFEARNYRRTVKWDPIAIPQRVTDIRERFPIRHLGDLLLLLRIPWPTARDWGAGRKAARVRSWHWKAGRTTGAEFFDRPALPPHPEWLAACDGIPIPKNHDLHFLRYISHPTLKQFRKRFDELNLELSGGLGIGEHDSEMLGRALHTAADEVVGATYVQAIKRRSKRRKAKFGFDPIETALRWSEKTHGAPRRSVVEAVIGAVTVEWTELAEQKRAERARMSPTDRKRAFVPPTARRLGSRKEDRARLRQWAEQRVAERARQLTDEAFLQVLGYVPGEGGMDD